MNSCWLSTPSSLCIEIATLRLGGNAYFSFFETQADMMLHRPIIQQPLSLQPARTVNNKRPYYTYSRQFHPL